MFVTFSPILTWRILQYERIQFMIILQRSMIPARLAPHVDGLLFSADNQIGLRIIAIRAQYKFTNETVQQILQFGRLVRTVYYKTIVLEIELRLSSEFATEIFRRIWATMRILITSIGHTQRAPCMMQKLLTSRRTTDSFGHLDHIHDDGFNTVAFSFHFGDKPRHLVTIESIADVSVHV